MPRPLFGSNSAPFSLTPLPNMLSYMNVLPEPDRTGIESTILLSEIEDAVDALPSSKTPGPDGLNALFFKGYENVISQYLVELYKHAYEVRNLPTFLYESTQNCNL